jgi:hypothetical protein
MKKEIWEGHFSPETEEGIRNVLKMGEELKKQMGKGMAREIIQIESITDCPFCIFDKTKETICTVQDNGCNDKNYIIPEHCPLHKSDILITLKKDKE